jgi:hypothetical protein
MKSNTNVNMNKFLESILYGSIGLDESSRRPWGVVNPRYTVW